MNIKKLLAVAILILFIGMSVIPSTGTVVEKKSAILTFYDGDTLYVGGTGPNNYTSIQDAIDAANPGDTIYVYNGTYHENIYIYKTISLIGEDKNTTIIDINFGLKNVIEIAADNTYVGGFTLKESKTRAGVEISSNNNIITNNIMFDNNQGIMLAFTENNNISGNIFQNNNHGIYLWPVCVGNIFTNNTIFSSVQGGIYVNWNSYDNVFYHNVIFDSVSASSNNIWDNGYPSGGNYWNNYQGTDADGDGIGDTLHHVSGGNYDRYPLGFFCPYVNFTYLINDLTLQFNASESRDPDGYITSYSWFFGDGGEYHNGPAFVINHTYSEYGTYQVSLKAIDNAGKSTILSKLVSNGNRPPNTPSNPNPPDGIMCGDVNVDLIWTGGDPDAGDIVLYDVYFGTTSPPPLVVHNQSEASYDPGILDFETTYYWKIVAWDNHGVSAEGPIWDFTSMEIPIITNVTLTTSDPLDTEPGFGWEKFFCTVTDNIGVDTVKIIITYPDNTIDEYPMTHIPSTDVYYYYTTFTDAGYYKYYIWANNTNGNTISTSQIFALPMNEDVNMDGCVTPEDADFYIPPGGLTGPPGWIREDVNNNGCLDFGDILQITLHMGECWPTPPWLIPPDITNIMLTTSDPLDTEPGFGWEKFSCTVTDNEAVDEVLLVLIYPDLHTEYIPMIKNGDIYYYNTTLTDAGEYTYHIWADDAEGNNVISASGTFALPANHDVDGNGQTYFDDLIAVVMMYGDTGTNGWVREDVDNNGQVYFDDFIAVVMHYGEWWK